MLLKNIRDTYTTGSSRLDPDFYGVRVVHICVFWVLVWPYQLFVRLWNRVSDVLDLSLVSKRFGFWPHITHVIVLTFKEIKHLSDYRTVGLSDCRIIGRTPYRTVLNWFNIQSFIKLSKRSKILIFTTWLSSGLSRWVVGFF